MISIWGVEGVWQDPNILLSRVNSEISLACLVLFRWKILSVWSVCKFCGNLWAVTEMGLTHLLSLLLPATKLHGWFYWLELRICFWATGHWIQISRSSDVFLVWVILKLFYTVELCWKAGARVTRYTSFLYAQLVESPDTLIGKESKARITKKLNLVSVSILYLRIYWVYWVWLKTCTTCGKKS